MSMRTLYYHTSSLASPAITKLPYCHPPSQIRLPQRKSPLFLPVQRQRVFPVLGNPNCLHRNRKPINLIHATMSSSTPSAAETDSNIKPFSVLFVCLGNICRSPAAEGVFRDLVKKRGLDSKFNIDSAGTINYHEGDQADARMRAASKKRGIEITSISRPIRPSDFIDFDLILAMDRQNREDILSAFERWRHRESLPDNAAKKVRLMCSYCKKHEETEVPDPYYGGAKGFEKLNSFSAWTKCYRKQCLHCAQCAALTLLLSSLLMCRASFMVEKYSCIVPSCCCSLRMLKISSKWLLALVIYELFTA